MINVFAVFGMYSMFVMCCALLFMLAWRNWLDKGD